MCLCRFLRLRCIEEVPLAGGGTFHWEFANPNELLADAVRNSEPLAALFKRAAAASRPSMASPWRLVVGYDEFAPGNKLNVDNRRIDILAPVAIAASPVTVANCASAHLSCGLGRTERVSVPACRSGKEDDGA